MIFKKEKGMSFFLAVMITAIILSLALSASTLFLQQTRALRNLGGSVLAFGAAETGIERTLYEISQGTLADNCPPVLGTIEQCQATLSNYASYVAIYLEPNEGGCPATAQNYCVKSIGDYRGVKRAIRVIR